MERRDLETLREKVSCAAVLESDGWKFDQKESTRRAVKYRRGQGEIIIVTHEGKGWFDPLSEAKGDVFALSEHLGGCGFGEALQCVSELVGFVSSQAVWRKPIRYKTGPCVTMRWSSRPRIKPGSLTWRYLNEVRHIPATILDMASAQNCIHEGPYGSLWAAHKGHTGLITGWEERGPQWRGFATGGSKQLFQIGATNPKRVCVTEASIDALSLAAIELAVPVLFSQSLYVSTGGGWSPATETALRAFAQIPALHLIAATDRNRQGDVYAQRLRLIAQEASCQFFRLLPHHEDWNEDLKVLSQRQGKPKNRGGELMGEKPSCRVPEGAHQG